MVPEGGKDGRLPWAWDTGLAAHQQERGNGRASGTRKWPGRGESSRALGLVYDRDHSWPRLAGTLQGTDAQDPSVTIGGKGPPGPPLSVWCPHPCTPASPSARSSPTPPPPRDHRAHAQAARSALQSAQGSAGHHQEHPHPCQPLGSPDARLLLLPRLRNLSSLPATRVKTLSLVLTHTTAVPSQSLLAPTSTQNPPARTCAPLTTLGPGADGSLYWVSPPRPSPRHRPPTQPPKRLQLGLILSVQLKSTFQWPLISLQVNKR